MKTRLVLRMALGNLTRRRTRTALTVLGVGLGVLVVTAFLGIAEGLVEATQLTLETGGTDVTVFDARASADLLSTLNEEEVRARLLALDGVNELSGSFWSVLPAEGTPFLFIEGLRLNEFILRQRRIVEGRTLQADGEILLGRSAARVMEAKVGDEIQVAKQPFRVVGIFETGIIYRDGGAVMEMDALRGLSRRPGVVTLFYVDVRDGVDPAAVATAIEASGDDIVAVRSVDDYQKVDQGIRVIRGARWTIGALAIFVGMIGVMNTMWMSVFERTREIGVLRAVGWPRLQIMLSIAAESVAVTSLGGVLGIVGGVVVARVLTLLPWAEQVLSPSFGPGVIAIATAVALLTGILGGLYPAYRASRLEPIEALRYE